MRLLSELVDLQRLTSIGVDPDTEALTDGTTSLTWAEFELRIGRLSALLIGLGVEPGDRVAIRLPKGCDSFVAVHAVIRSGAVMVPLDPLAPPTASVDVLTDAGVDVLIGDRRAVTVADAAEVGTIVVLGSASEAEHAAGRRIVGEADLARVEPVAPVQVEPDDPAYIIYTSGSTGLPKGIVHSHRSALAYATAAAAEYELTSADRFANIAPLHFDQSTFELYAAPLVGGAVLVIPDPVLRFPASVAELVEREEISVWYSVPYLLEQLSSRGALDDRDLSRLRWVLFGGESFPHQALARLMRQLPDARFSNVYGPAEVNQCMAFHLDVPPHGAVPIGRAWDAAQIRLVDTDDPAALRPVDGDGTGLVAVASSTMMSGYWRHPELTASTIVTDESGTCWYLTGDLAERGEHGLTFLGRVDHQVKLRGHRIELEAIDAALRDASDVAAATVVVDRAGDEPRLVAFVVPTPTGEPEAVTGSTTERLRERLPRYAVPTEIRVVPSLPRTPTGKIDRTAASRLLEP